MAEEPKSPPAPKKIQRVQIGLNVLVQAAAVVFLVAAVNYLGFEHYKRWDLTRDKQYTLSDKTKRFLDSMKGKAKIIVFFAPDTPITGDLNNLLTGLQHAAKNKLDVEHVDPTRNISRAKEMFDKYKVISNESLIVIDYEGRNKAVKASEMADIDPGNRMMGDGSRVTAFKGEQAITSALIDLVEGKKNTLGYMLGHKEPPLSENSPVSVLKTFIENENIKFQELNLFDTDTLPPDITAIMIAGPQYDLSDREMKILREFWDKQGRLLVLLDPSAQTPKLRAFLDELGVKVNDDRLIAMVRTGIQEMARVRDVIGRFLPDTPITGRLADVRAAFVGGTSSLTLETNRVRAGNIQLIPLAEAEKGYWAESDYNSDDDAKLQFTEGRDRNTSLTMAAAVEKGGSPDARTPVNSSRLVVVSNSTFIQDNALSQGQQGLDFVSGCVNWLLSREQLIGIAPKVPKTLTFSVDEADMRRIRWIILVLLPLVPAVIGTAVWWQRRA